jgi:RHS repeat-associated protein
MEKDDEIKGEGNSYDFGARIYDPRVARWLSLDPLMKKYPDLTPYNSMGNDPISIIDEDGRELVEIIIKTKSPNIQGKLSLVVDTKIAGQVKELVKYAIDNDIPIHFNSHFRSSKDQAAVQKTGLTPAKVGSSRHEGGFALDFNLYIEKDGKLIISSQNKDIKSDNPFIVKAKELGFRWGGEFSKKDPIHIDAWPAGESSKYGYESWADAYNENQASRANKSYSSEVFEYNKGDSSSSKQVNIDIGESHVAQPDKTTVPKTISDLNFD